MIVVHGTGPSCKALAKGLDGLWHSAHSGNTFEWSRARAGWRQVRRVARVAHTVNYGTSTGRGLNANIVHNKYRQLQIMREAGISVPDHSTRRPTGEGWLARAFQHQRGTDIRQPTVAPGREQVRFVNADMPADHVCRACHHGQLSRRVVTREAGRVTYPQADYYVRLMPKEREFRVHVINGISVRMCEKIPNRREDIVWNSNNSHFSFADVAPRDVRHAVRAAAKAAVAALGMDFGAVDVMLCQNQCYVLEVNSAPCLTDNEPTLNRYIEHIRGWANEER